MPSGQISSPTRKDVNYTIDRYEKYLTLTKKTEKKGEQRKRSGEKEESL